MASSASQRKKIIGVAGEAYLNHLWRNISAANGGNGCSLSLSNIGFGSLCRRSVNINGRSIVSKRHEESIIKAAKNMASSGGESDVGEMAAQGIIGEAA